MRLLLLLLLVQGLASAQTVIVDDQDGSPTFNTTGNDWTTWGMLGYGFDGGDTDYHYLSHTLGGPDRRGTATWFPDLPVAGQWAISTWFRRTENRSWDADHVVVDGTGASAGMVFDQTGEGASGWLDLGTWWCDEGFGGCTVTLDGTDDDQSDEANAVRFVLVSAEPGPGDDDDDADPCATNPGPGDHVQAVFAGSISGNGWSSEGQASGGPDGAEAHSGNVDEGELLAGAGFPICDPDGDELITAVEVAVRARTQYASGPYDVLLELNAGGASMSWHGTNLSWRTLDVTADRASWTWADVAALQAQLVLDSHPGGNRDSDAWVDAFRVRAWYTSLAEGDDDDATAEGDDDDATAEADDDDATAEADDDDATEAAEEPAALDLPPEEAPESQASAGCWQDVDSVALLLPFSLAARRRRSGRP